MSKKQEVGKDDSTPVHTDTTMTQEIDSSSKIQQMTPVAKEELVGEVEKDLTSKKSKRKKRKNKESRQKRLLKYHEKLVKTSGLPPSRLMEKQRHGPDSLVTNNLKRSLAGEFEQMGGVYEPGSVARPNFKLPAEPAHGTTPDPVTAIPPPGTVTDLTGRCF